MSRDWAAEFGGIPSGTRGEWPIESISTQVHETQVKEAAEYDRKLGVPTDYTRDGKPIWRDSSHRKAFLRAHGITDRSGY